MEIDCLQENLKSGLGAAGNAVAAKHTLSILGGILVTAEDGSLVLASSNLELAITQCIGGKVKTDGASVVPYKLLLSLINELPNNALVNLSTLEHVLEVRTENSSARIHCQDSKDFPPTPDCSGGQVITILASELRQAIDLTVFGVAKGYERPVLCGVNVRAIDGKLQFASTDGFRLAVYTSSTPANDLNVIVPARTLAVVSKLCRAATGDDHDQSVAVQFARPDKEGDVRVVEFTIGRTCLVSQLISGTFPEYQKLIPTDPKTTATIDLADLLRAVKIASVVARDSSGTVRLEIDTDHMRVSGRSGETGDSVTEISVSLAGEQSMRVAVDYRHLVELLGTLRGLSVSAITLAIVSDTQPCIVRPVGIDGYTYVVMSMSAQWETEK